MLREDRRHARKRVEQDTDALFQVQAEDFIYPLGQVCDISVSGTGFELPIPLARSTPVTLSYESDACEIKVQATVVWCQPSSDESYSPYRIGVRFDPHDQHNSSLFFLALREHYGHLGSV